MAKKKCVENENLQQGISSIYIHSLFRDCFHCPIKYDGKNLGKGVYAKVSANGHIFVNEKENLTSKQWAYVIAHNMLHLAFGHFDLNKMPAYQYIDENGNKIRKADIIPEIWNMACDIYVDSFLQDIKFGDSIHDLVSNTISLQRNDEIGIYEYLLANKELQNVWGTANVGELDMEGLSRPIVYDEVKGECNRYSKIFSSAIVDCVSRTIEASSGIFSCNPYSMSAGKKAAKWFIEHYPLLGAIASHYEIIEDNIIAYQENIHIAAIDIENGKIYLNPSAKLSDDEWKFVLAHEYLHAGLSHHMRTEGRKPYFWNVACDYVINGWLNELMVGKMPEGVLYDPELKGLSAESIYDMIVANIKKYEKLDTLRGNGKGDIIGYSSDKKTSGIELDEFCKNAMQQGLEYHISMGRGLIPAGLIQEIRALAMPPIPWDVQLAEWFNIYFAPLEKHRTYLRPSRRQASTPDIPRPKYELYSVPIESRTFGVIIDTSGSMDTVSIGKALGSIASYSMAHDVPYARVVFCDAQAYDVGYLSPEDIAGRVMVKGRGGTKLQPAVDLLESADDFPEDGPILIITDGAIENSLTICREHAYLLPKGCRLPFKDRGAIFYFK